VNEDIEKKARRVVELAFGDDASASVINQLPKDLAIALIRLRWAFMRADGVEPDHDRFDVEPGDGGG
jgi:hypothetical protein